MFYRIRADIPFTSADEANDFYVDCQKAIIKGSVINPHQPDEERGVIQEEKCFHDEDPHIPCVILHHELAPYPPE